MKCKYCGMYLENVDEESPNGMAHTIKCQTKRIHELENEKNSVKDYEKTTQIEKEEKMKHTRQTIIELINETKRVVVKGIDLSDQDLSSLDLSGLDLWGADLRGANLRGANLRGANLQEANLRGADLRGADLWGANLQWADLREAELQSADLQRADLQRANLQDADLRGADLRGANLLGAKLKRANLREADLQDANLDFTGYELSCRTIGIIADSRLVSQLLYHICSMNVQDCPEWDELRNDERVIALANQSHVITAHGQPVIEPLKAQEEK